MKKLILLFTLCAVCSGCAVFKVGDLPQARLQSPSPNNSKLTVSYNLRARANVFSEADMHPKYQEKLRKELGEALRKTGYFGRVSQTDKNADLKLSVLFMERGNPAAVVPAFITGFSMFTIPCWATSHQEITITAKNGDLSKTYRAEDSARMFIWLPMAVLFPFHNFSTATDMQENMYYTLLEQFRRDGLLVKKEEPVPVVSEELPSSDTAKAGVVPPAS